jgi:hypothetical protein
VPPVIEQGRTLVPLRAIFEALGADVKWDGSTQTVIAIKAGKEIKLIIGGQAYKNGQPVTLDVPAKIVDGRTMVPLRFVSEALGTSVRWEDATQTVSIYSLGEQPDEATFKKYFSDMGLGKLPAGGQLPQDIQRNIHVFAPGDQICLYGTLTQEVIVSSAIYDSNSQKPVIEKHGYPRPMPPGGFAGSERIELPEGKYDYKVYAGDVLVAIFPIEIRLNPVVDK